LRSDEPRFERIIGNSQALESVLADADSQYAMELEWALLRHWERDGSQH
jgi:hypothetical protein